jgi:hypothetical protein
MNSSCGCVTISGCGDHLNKWTVGTQYICDSECGSPEGCNTCSEMIVCYMFRMCRHESYHIDSFCIDGACRWTIAGLCTSCEPYGSAFPQTVCTQTCE